MRSSSISTLQCRSTIWQRPPSDRGRSKWRLCSKHVATDSLADTKDIPRRFSDYPELILVSDSGIPQKNPLRGVAASAFRLRSATA